MSRIPPVRSVRSIANANSIATTIAAPSRAPSKILPIALIMIRPPMATLIAAEVRIIVTVGMGYMPRLHEYVRRQRGHDAHGSHARHRPEEPSVLHGEPLGHCTRSVTQARQVRVRRAVYHKRSANEETAISDN
jgi:hypothetical protein